MRITRTRPNAAVATLGRDERVIQVDGAGDGPAIHTAKAAIVTALAAYLSTHPDISSVQVVAARRYGGYTVDQYDREDLSIVIN